MQVAANDSTQVGVLSDDPDRGTRAVGRREGNGGFLVTESPLPHLFCPVAMIDNESLGLTRIEVGLESKRFQKLLGCRSDAGNSCGNIDCPSSLEKYTGVISPGGHWDSVRNTGALRSRYL